MESIAQDDGGRQRLAAVVAGDADAREWLLRQIAPIVYGFLYPRVSGDAPVAADLLQDTLVEGLRGLDSYRADGPPEAWFLAIARRRLARHWEAERRAQVVESGLRAVTTDAVRSGSDEVDERDEIIRALAPLPPLQRQVLVLKYLEECTVREIARTLGRTEVQVQSLLQRAREALRTQLEKP